MTRSSVIASVATIFLARREASRRIVKNAALHTARPIQRNRMSRSLNRFLIVLDRGSVPLVRGVRFISIGGE